jgi:MacB-like periplasmic core domain
VNAGNGHGHALRFGGLLFNAPVYVCLGNSSRGRRNRSLDSAACRFTSAPRELCEYAACRSWLPLRSRAYGGDSCLPQKNPDFVRRTQFFQTILERVRALPGVKSAGFMSVLPLIWKSGMAGFLPQGAILRPEISYAALDRVVSHGYFETMRIPLIRGRLFDESDGPDASSVVIINQTMARKFWANEDALGKRLRFNLGGGNFRLTQIVGIVGDVKQMGLGMPPKEEMYFPYWQAKGIT